MFICLERIMDPLIHIPAMIETYNDVSYAVFRITQSLSSISVEAVLFYPFEMLQASHDGKLFLLYHQCAILSKVTTRFCDICGLAASDLLISED